MKFMTAQNFTSLAELMRFYCDADEIVFKSYCDLDEQEIAELCRRARRLVYQLRLHQGAKRAAEVAQIYGATVLFEEWQAFEGKANYLSEYSLHPPKISLNMDAIRSMARLMPHWANQNELVWFTETQIAEVTTAQELYRLIEPRVSSGNIELAASAFARTFTGLPFSPLLYRDLLIRLLKGKGAAQP